MILRGISQFIVKKELYVPTYDVRIGALLVDGECLHSQLHTIETRRFPHRVDDEIVGDIHRYSFTLPQLESDFIGDIYEEAGQLLISGGITTGYSLFGILMI